LKFPGIPFIDRLRVGMVAAYLKFSGSWKSFEKYTAHEWLQKTMGVPAYKALWEPMLEGKFGQKYYKEVNMAWFWARIHARTHRLGTFVGGFQAFMDLLAERVRSEGGEIRLETPVERVESAGAEGLRISAGGTDEVFDRVLSTTSPAALDQTVAGLPDDYVAAVRDLKSLGAVVIVLSLDRPLGPGIYWYNLPKRAGFPFLCLVEHTAFVPPENFGGDHIVYCGDYVPPEHRYFSMDKEELLQEFAASLVKVNPEFSKEWIRDSWLFKDTYAQPVPTLHHSLNIPEVATPIPGLYWASMSHVYPWDRGTNYAVEIGRATAARMLEEASAADPA
jgi:protoporphyrinogen oxidase